MNESAKQRALSLLDKRDYSRKMLLDKLTEKGIPSPDAEEVADWLCSLGVVNDERYAALVVRHYAAKGYGEHRIKDELYRRGIDKELWETALEEMPAQEDKLDALILTRLRGAEPTKENLSRVTAYLARKGYSWSEIREALDRLRIEEE